MRASAPRLARSEKTMKFSTIFYLYRVRLRSRAVQELLAVAGIATGVALLFASQVANTSLAGSVARLTNSLVGSSRLQIVARDPRGFSEKLLADVEMLPGVQVASPVLERNVNIVGPGGSESIDLIGVDARFVRLGGRLLSHFSASQIPAQRGIALPQPLARNIGVKSLQPVVVQVGAESPRTTVALTLDSSEIGTAVDSPIAILPLQIAQSLTGMQGRVTRILVEPKHGQDLGVQKGLEGVAKDGLNVRPANFDAAVFHQAEGPTVQSTQLFSAISALVGFLFAFNAMLLTVPQRRNLINDLRLDGYTPLEITEVMLFDALALGVMGTIIGLAFGDVLSQNFLQADPGYLSLAFPVGSLHLISSQSVIIATVGGLLAAVIGVIIPLRGDIFGYALPGVAAGRGKRSMGSALALVSGFGCVALTTVILIGGMNTVVVAVLAFTSLTFAVLLILPVVFNQVLLLIDRMQLAVSGVASTIALIELMSSATRARSLAIAATGAMAVYGSVAIEGARGDLSGGLAHAAADLSFGTDLWVSPAGGATTLATTPFKDDYRRTLEMLPSVERVDLYRGGFLDLGDRRVLVVAPAKTSSRLVPASQITRGMSVLAMSRLRQDGWITMSQILAHELNLHTGESFVLSTPRPTRFRLAAIMTNLGWSPGAIVMNADDFARAWGSEEISAYQVTLKPGVVVARGADEVRRAIGSSTALVVQSAVRHEHNDIAAQKQGLARLTQIAALVLVAAALAMAAAMGAMIWQRRPRLAGMKVDGFAQGELWRALLWETTLLLGTGSAIGAVFGLYGQLVLSHALVSVTGFPVVFSIGIVVAVLSVTIVTALALAVVALPGYLASQVKPALQD
jgi:putative ABC transport system permease protein